VVAQQFGGTGVDASGNLHEYGYLPYGISPGVYTYGFMLCDARGLRTTSGPGRIAMPGGPLQITVIDN
jgi:hypothetical protein